MSEKLIDHEFEDGGNGACIFGYVPPDGAPGCGQPRSRHRQDAADALDDAIEDVIQPMTLTPKAAIADLLGCIETHGFPTDREAWARIVEPALAACAGAADQQPGELATLRAAGLQAICSYCGHVTQYESLLERNSAFGRERLVEHIIACGKRPELVAYAQAQAIEERATKAEASLAQALLVIKTADTHSAVNIAGRMTTLESLDAFEALRKDGKLTTE